jgi:N-acetylglucosamine-6-phosphate deacetylase
VIIQASSAIVDGSLCDDLWVETSGGAIASVNTGKHDNPDKLVDGVLIPGFVDIHCHGGGGYYFSASSPESISAAINAHKKTGTTSLVASLVSESIDDLKAQIQRLAPFYNRGEIVGIHLEGPYLSHARCGAHEPSLLIDPTVAQVKELIALGQGSIKMVTIAPELNGAQEAIKYLASVGVIAAIGHTEGDFQDASAATGNGAAVVTHFLNAMNKENTQGSIANFVINDPRLAVELIVDGHHLSFEMVKELFASLGPRIIMVSDAMAAAGNGDGNYTIGALPVEVKDGVARLVSNKKLAGSTLTISEAFTNLMNHCGLSLEQAVHATSTQPAKAFGLKDRGSIAVGMQADLLSYNTTTKSVTVIS